MSDKEWSENPEDDPVELQKQQLKLGKEFLDRIKKQEEAEAERRKQYAEAPIAAPAYTPPSFEEVCEALAKAWAGVERIMPTAPDEAKSIAFQALIHTMATAHRMGF